MPSKIEIMELYGEVELKRAPLDDRIVRCALTGVPMMTMSYQSWTWKYVGYSDNSDNAVEETYHALKNVMWYKVKGVVETME